VSAVLQGASPLPAPRKLNEAEATHEISRLASAGIELETTLDRIAAAALAVRGIRRVRLEPGPELSAHLLLEPVWGRSGGDTTDASAVGEIKAGAWWWGRYRIWFDVRETRLENPLAFARFVAEQIACFLNRLALRGERDTLLRKKDRMEDRLKRRKLVERAKGILVERHSISQEEALRLLVRITRETKRSLRRVAQSIIFARA
jgi:hypothetical protein